MASQSTRTARIWIPHCADTWPYALLDELAAKLGVVGEHTPIGIMLEPDVVDGVEGKWLVGNVTVVDPEVVDLEVADPEQKAEA